MTDFLDNVPCRFGKWFEAAIGNYRLIHNQLETGYGLPELEYLRIETCFSIMHGLWQGAVCLTNVLLESFLKLALMYSNVAEPEAGRPPVTHLLGSLAGPVQNFARLKLHNN